MNSAANMSPSYNGVIPLPSTLRILLAAFVPPHPPAQRIAGRIPPNDRTEKLSSGTLSSCDTNCTTPVMALRTLGATDSLTSTSATTSSAVSSDRVRLRKFRTTMPSSTMAKSLPCTVPTDWAPSLAENDTRTSETWLRNVATAEASDEVFWPNAAQRIPSVSAKTNRICLLARIAVLRCQSAPDGTLPNYGGY